MLSVTSVVELLKFADLYETKELKIKAFEFIQKNLKSLTTTGRFCESLSIDLVHEVMCQLVDT